MLTIDFEPSSLLRIDSREASFEITEPLAKVSIDPCLMLWEVPFRVRFLEMTDVSCSLFRLLL